MAKTEIDITIPDDVYYHFAALAKAADVSLEDYVSQVITRRISVLLEQEGV